MIKLDEYSGQIEFISNDFGTRNRTFEVTYRISSIYLKENIDIEIQINEVHPFSQTLEQQKIVIWTFLGISFTVGTLSAFSPKSGFIGLWMLVHQYQLLMLLTMIETDIHPDVRKIITGESFLALNLQDVSGNILRYVRLDDNVEKLQKSQTNQGLEELDYSSLSCLQMNTGVIILLSVLIATQLIVIVSWSIYIDCKLKWLDRQIRNLEEGNDPQNYGNCDYNPFYALYNCCCKCCCRLPERLAKWAFLKISKKITFWGHKYLPLRFFLNMYMRLFIETIFTLSITSCNELAQYYLGNKTSDVSFKFALGSLSWCILFLIFLLYYSCINLRTIISEDDPEPGIFFDGIFADFKQGWSRIYNWLSSSRLFLYACIVFIPKMNSHVIFGIIFGLQFLYYLQTCRFRKFENPAFSFVNLINEGFFLMIVAFLGHYYSRSQWDENDPKYSMSMRITVIGVIVANTGLITLVEMASMKFNV
ncbi:unnamed protein product [Moneuplotes crassus]|uniref:Uncharacterized protein n=1 Tax=Euplotes crassus TaxID=5936 RepID=A0AAD1XJM3_EUPCR|nr:unnamed protein product [Moneuplotes crassus]